MRSAANRGRGFNRLQSILQTFDTVQGRVVSIATVNRTHYRQRNVSERAGRAQLRIPEASTRPTNSLHAAAWHIVARSRSGVFRGERADISTSNPQSGVSRREMLKGMAVAAIAGGLSSGVGAKTANDPPYRYPRIRLPTGGGIPVSDSESVVETHMARFSDAPMTVSMLSKPFPIELILPVQIASCHRRNPRRGPEFVAVFITELCAHRRDLQDGRTMKNFGCSPGTTAPLAKTA